MLVLQLVSCKGIRGRGSVCGGVITVRGGWDGEIYSVRGALGERGGGLRHGRVGAAPGVCGMCI